MRSQPAVVIIARHASRLDQASKDWHTQAEKPWDSPLSYGGWIQSQTLGARIATELAALDVSELSNEADEDELRPKKKRKIIIHTSPFLRCLQTSIGLAAGLRYPQDYARTRQLPPQVHFPRSSLSKPPILPGDGSLSPTADGLTAEEQHEKQENGDNEADDDDDEMADMKIDAFLGEWLSSGYYEKIGPPAPSDVLVKAAKDFLKLPAEEIKGADLVRTSLHAFEELEWDEKDNEDAVLPPLELTGLRAMAVLGQALPQRSRTLSFGKDVGGTAEQRHHRRVRSSTYSPPVPTYSIAPQDSIPVGFVAHARDACIRTDYDWDSQQAPLDWGDGGQYDEEWVAMHRRFRNGLQQMLSYYDLQASESDKSPAVNDDEDIVLILVTHQAGCNALIRLVTGAPALHDVGTASLTMAVRKPACLTRKASDTSDLSPTRQRRGSLDLGLAEEFDMKIIASTEHLRGGSNPLGLNSPRLGHSPAFASRRVVGAESLEGFSIGDPLSRRANSFHPMNRSSSLRSYTTDSSPRLAPVSGTGLWGIKPRTTSFGAESADLKSSPATSKTGTILEDDENSGSEAVSESPISTSSKPLPQSQPHPLQANLPVRSASQRVAASAGLWGSGANGSSGGTGLWTPPAGLPVRSIPHENNADGARRPGQRRWTAAGSR